MESSLQAEKLSGRLLTIVALSAEHAVKRYTQRATLCIIINLAKPNSLWKRVKLYTSLPEDF
jgi:hypothetical protein